MSRRKIISTAFAIMATVIMAAVTTGANSHTNSPGNVPATYIQTARIKDVGLIPGKVSISYFASSTATSAATASSAAESTAGTAVDAAASSSNTTNEKASSSNATAFFPLTAAERDKIERILMSSCGACDSLMAKANAQVILDRVKSGRFGKSVDEVLDAPHQFEKPWTGRVNTMVKNAVSAVFDRGERVTDTNIYYYVNPNLSVISAATWRKDKRYVVTIGKGEFIHQYWTDKN